MSDDENNPEKNSLGGVVNPSEEWANPEDSSANAPNARPSAAARPGKGKKVSSARMQKLMEEIAEMEAREKPTQIETRLLRLLKQEQRKLEAFEAASNISESVRKELLTERDRQTTVSAMSLVKTIARKRGISQEAALTVIQKELGV